MVDGSLTFAIPVRDPRGVSDWGRVTRDLSATLESLLAQRGPKPKVVLGVGKGTSLPPLPTGVEVVEVELPYRPLPDGEGPARWDAICADKGLRLAHALAEVKPQGHVMVVDYDDLVSTRLSSAVAEEPEAAGWFVDAGYLWDGGPLVSVVSHGFNEACGTSLIIRADLLRVPSDPSDRASLGWIKATLGSHKLWRGLFELEPLGFPGAVYRVGSGSNVSGAEGLARRVVRGVRRPRELGETLGGLRPWAAVRRQFGA